MMKKLAKLTALLAVAAFLLAGFPACSSDDDDGDPTLDKIEIKVDESEVKTTYTVGEDFDRTGITVTATYSDGSTKDVSDEAKYEATCDGAAFTTATAGDFEVTLTATYGGKTDSVTCPIKVKAGGISGGDTGNGGGNTGTGGGDNNNPGNEGDDSGNTGGEGEKEPGEATTATVTVAEGFVDRTTNDFSYRPTAEGTAAGGDVLGEVPGFKLALADGTASYTISSNKKATPDDSSYTLAYRVKLGGNAKFANGTVQQALVVTAEKPCMVTFYVRSSSSTNILTFQPFAADGTKLIENMAANVNPNKDNDITYVVSFNMTGGTCYFGASEGGPGVCGVDVKFTE